MPVVPLAKLKIHGFTPLLCLPPLVIPSFAASEFVFRRLISPLSFSRQALVHMMSLLLFVQCLKSISVSLRFVRADRQTVSFFIKLSSLRTYCSSLPMKLSNFSARALCSFVTTFRYLVKFLCKLTSKEAVKGAGYELTQ